MNNNQLYEDEQTKLFLEKQMQVFYEEVYVPQCMNWLDQALSVGNLYLINAAMSEYDSAIDKLRMIDNIIGKRSRKPLGILNEQINKKIDE